jgi:hypothetical protein
MAGAYGTAKHLRLLFRAVAIPFHPAFPTRLGGGMVQKRLFSGTTPDLSAPVGQITKSEPISIVKPEPPVAVGQGSGCPAHITKPLGTQGSARSDVEHGMWRGAVSPLGSGAQTVPVKAVAVGRATAESPGAGCDAGRDRMTSVLSRSLSVSRWRRWIRAWGRDEPATDEPAA